MRKAAIRPGLAYDNGRTVADESAILTDFVQRSQQAYAQLAALRNVPYASANRCTLDRFDARTPIGTVIFLHGGYWQWCNKEDFAFIAMRLVPAGYTCILVEYPLAPAVTVTDISACIGLALDYLATRPDLPRPVTLVGHSAGAHLAACHMHHPLLASAQLLSGIYDLAPLRHTHLDAALALSDAEIAASPIHTIDRLRIPCMIACGEDELPELKMQSRTFAQALQHFDPTHRVTLQMLPDCHHFTILDAWVDTFVRQRQSDMV